MVERLGIHMFGIVIVSHGKMAEGLEDSCRLFFPNGLENVKTCCLFQEDGPDEFEEKIDKCIQEVDVGEGAVVLCDLYGGTPCNCAARLVMRKYPDVPVITGVNLAMLLELLGYRLSQNNIKDIDLQHIMDSGKKGVILVNDALNRKKEDDFFE